MENEKEKLIYQINYIEETQLDKKVRALIEEVTNKYPEVYIKIRIKDIESATKKLNIKNYKYASQISDLLGVMIITKSINQVYQIKTELETIIPNVKVQDYIETPKFGYKSVHLNCLIKENIPLEIQIKTEKMKIAQEMVHDSIYKNNSLNKQTKNILSMMAYKTIENFMNLNYKKL